MGSFFSFFLFFLTNTFQNFLPFYSAAECYSTELQWPMLIVSWIPWTELEPSFANVYDDNTYPHLFLAQLTRHSCHFQLRIMRAEQSEPDAFQICIPLSLSQMRKAVDVGVNTNCCPVMLKHEHLYSVTLKKEHAVLCNLQHPYSFQTSALYYVEC